MSDTVVTQLQRLLHGSALPVAAGPSDQPAPSAPRASTDPTSVGGLLVGLQSLERAFEELAAAPAALRARVSQAVAAVTEARAEGERIVAAVEADVASQLSSARALLAAIQSAGATLPTASPNAGEVTELAGALAGTALLSSQTESAVSASLAKLAAAQSDKPLGGAS